MYAMNYITYIYIYIYTHPLQWTIPEAVFTVICSWWWAKTSPETCRAD